MNKAFDQSCVRGCSFVNPLMRHVSRGARLITPNKPHRSFGTEEHRIFVCLVRFIKMYATYEMTTVWFHKKKNTYQ